MRRSVPRSSIKEGYELLRVTNLSKSFDGVQAVDDVSFDLAAGQLLALIGPNGAGKSTCFNMVNGQLKPSAGSIIFRRPRISPACVRATSGGSASGRTFQIAATFNSMTVHRERADGARHRASGVCSACGNPPHPCMPTKRWHCSIRSAWPATRGARAACLHMAT